MTAWSQDLELPTADHRAESNRGSIPVARLPQLNDAAPCLARSHLLRQARTNSRTCFDNLLAVDS
jgi:hypothetical protein